MMRPTDPYSITEFERHAKAYIKQAIAEGRTRPASEVFAEIRANHGF